MFDASKIAEAGFPLGYTEEFATKLMKGRAELSLLDILGLEIPVNERIWIAVSLIPDRDARLFAAAYAQSMLHLLPKSVRHKFEEGVQVSRDFANGKISAKEMQDKLFILSKESAGVIGLDPRDAAWSVTGAMALNDPGLAAWSVNNARGKSGGTFQIDYLMAYARGEI